MVQIPIKVKERLYKEIPKFKKILERIKDRDVNEADTVTVVVDMLERVFGFDRYSEITREFQIRGTYCDLAIKMGGKVEYLVEVKAVGIKLNLSHVKQARDYGANKGILWVVLTNGVRWILYKISLKGKVEEEVVIDFNFLKLDHRKNSNDFEKVFILCKKGLSKNLMDEIYGYKKIVNSNVLVDILLDSEEVKSTIRKQLKVIGNGTKASDEEIGNLLKNEVIKREFIERRNADGYKSVVRKKKKVTKNKEKDEK